MMNYLDYMNNQPVMKAFFGNKMPELNPNDKDSVKKWQDWAVRNGYMTQAQVDTGYGTYGRQTKAAYAAAQQSGKSTSSSSAPSPNIWGRVGNLVNNAYSAVTMKPVRDFVSQKINQAALNSGKEGWRYVANVVNLPITGIEDAVLARTNSTINRVLPGWVPEQAQDQIGKGQAVWTVDKDSGIARYYDPDGKLQISSPAGTGLIKGAKQRAGDNKTPTGTFTLSGPQAGKSKPGGRWSFGPWFYRTNHKNNGSDKTSGVGIHGTGFPIFNGTNVSHGCVRVDNRAIRKFHKIAPNQGAGTKIVMYDENGGTI